MDAQLFTKLLQCEKARHFYHQKKRAEKIERNAEFAKLFEQNEIIQALFRNNCTRLHPLSNSMIKHKKIKIKIDNIMETTSGYSLIKIIYSAYVSSSNSRELALAVWALGKRKIIINKIYAIVLNEGYIRRGGLDINLLFTRRDISRHILVRSAKVDALLEKAAKDEESKSAFRAACFSSIKCPYSHICFKTIPKYSILNISGLEIDTKLQLLNSGIKKIKDIPEAMLTPYHRIQIEADKTKRLYIEKENLKRFLDTIEYPIHFLDFEAVNYPVPPFENLKVFEPLVFQYSLHILSFPGARARHFEFLSDGKSDPRREIAEKLRGEIAPSGSIVAFGAGFERMILRRLGEQFGFDGYANRVIDLALPFSKRFVYHHRMRGSHSLKSVAPSFVSKANYGGSIKSGLEAMRRFCEMQSAGKRQAAAIRAGLLEYCGQDTLYLVSIFRKLTRLVLESRGKTDD
ncbi:MAG: DUF2779 domain-containing protein [Helicobacteraceae bacterium]|nr:DUF2779 domain-containing protein [Helicobacteraceae bacterium]